MSASRTIFEKNAVTTIPAVGFGTFLISNGGAEDAIWSPVVSGYRHIDTASGYRNEENVCAGITRALEAEVLFCSHPSVTATLWPGNLA